MINETESLKPVYNVPNLERGLLIIELLAQNPEGLTLVEITNTISISKSSAFRTVSTLIFKNYLQKNEATKKITLSRKMLSLGISSVNQHSIVEMSIDVMRAMRDELKDSVMLGMVLGLKGLVLEQVPSLYPTKIYVEQGTQFNLHSSVGGKAILAFLPEQELNKILREIELTKESPQTIVSKEKLKKDLKKVKQRGYAIDKGEGITGINCVGAPIFNENGFPVAAIWMTAPKGRLCKKSFDKKGVIISKYASEISAKLGFFGIF